MLCISIKKDYNFWKVITTEAAYEHKSGFGNTFIGKPDEIHTGSYISFKLSNEDEAKSLLSYMKCRLPNFMLSLRKNSQHINEDVCKWIPLPPLNKEWTNKEVYKHFKLSETDIKLINDTNIVGYKNKIDLSNKEDRIDGKVDVEDEVEKVVENIPVHTTKITVPELKKLAKDHNLYGYSKLNKQDLIDFLTKNNIVIE